MNFTIIRSELKATLDIAMPLIATLLAQMSMEFVDTIMVGRLGPQALAAMALSGISYISILILFIGILTSVGILIAYDLGAKKHSLITNHLWQGFYLATILSIPAMVIVWFIPDLLLFIGENPSIVALCSDYLHAIVWGCPAFLFFVTLREYVSAVNVVAIVMWITFMTIPVNAILNYILIYGFLNIPAFGIAGAGYASSLAGLLMVLAIIYVILKKPKLHHHLKTGFKQPICFATIKEMLRIGGPVGIMMGFEVGLFAVIAMMMGFFGTHALAAHQIATQISSISFMCFLGLSQATAIRVSKALGEQNLLKAKNASHAGLFMGIVIAIIAAIIFLCLPKLIVSIFIDLNIPDNKKVLTLAIRFLYVVAMFQLFDALQIIMSGSLRGLKDTFTPMLVGLLSYWLMGLISGFILGFTLGYQGTGLWWGLTVGIAISGLLLWLRFQQHFTDSDINLACTNDLPT